MRFEHCLAGLTLALMASASQAAPVYYTFTGVATESSYGLIDVGQEVSYTFMLDFDAPAYYIEHSLRAEWPDNFGYDYFLVDFVAGDAIPEDWVGQYFEENHIGVNGPVESRLISANLDHYGSDALIIAGSGVISEWAVGHSAVGYNYSIVHGVQVNSALTLASISDAPPAAVPEPGSLALFGTGLLAMGAAVLRRRRA